MNPVDFFDAPIKPGESIVLTFDFANEAAAVSAPDVEVVVLWAGGVDPGDPMDIRVGPPQVDGAVVRQRVAATVDMTDYGLRCTAVSNTGDTLKIEKGLLSRSALK